MCSQDFMKNAKVLAWLLALLGFSFVSCRNTQSTADIRHGHDLEGSWNGGDHYQKMLDAKTFAFGGVGFAGTTSGGELGFRQVLSGPEPEKRFEDAYADATSEGRLYVLCGLRATHSSAFDRYVANLRSETNQVMTMSGCIGSLEPIKAVVQRIVNGEYDLYFTRTIPENRVNESNLRVQY
jgi:hypothetical protein